MRQNKDTGTAKQDATFDSNLCKRWLSGIPYEVAFWRSYYRNKKSRDRLMGWSQYKQECQLDKFDIASYICSLDHVPVIADVGCALSYIFGNTFGGKEYPVIYVDPLASFYNKILDDCSLDFPRITFGMGETLSLHFAKNSVSFFHMRNALDHSVCPIMIIWQALICLRQGGVLYLNHKPNEAEHEGYIGFHQYNIDCNDGKLIIWNRNESIDVGNILSGYAEVEASVTDEGRIVGIIRKKAELPENHEAVIESNKYAAGMLQTTIAYFHSFENSLSYQWRRAIFTIMHATMRLLPMRIVNKLKQCFLLKGE
ncbi:MAG: hypothetical protein J1F10_01420 [Muribaculaceae bacterium]|nr:hypothetical protein [Muribaculaceae bacterium]